MSSKRILELEALIVKYKSLYYQGRAAISDEKYDKLEDELRELDPSNPVLSLVGTDQGTGAKVTHSKKMLSLEKSYKTEDIEDFLRRGEALSVFKIDGSSCSLIYKNGKLEIAKTRGDGSRGEDITEKAKFIGDIPKTISMKEEMEVRGEIYCDLAGFKEISSEMIRLGLDAPSSQRNIVAGLLGRKEHISLSRHLRFQGFDLLGSRIKTEVEKLKVLKAEGIPTPSFVLHKDAQSIKARIEETKEFMQDGDYLIDGLVFVYNSLELHDQLGETSHHPRYKLAFKFQGDTKTTKINEITWQVSRNGRLTPVAEIAPTELSGAVINRVTLHNFGQVKIYQLKPGDEIEIVRSGEVIPKFLSVVKSSKAPWVYPQECPSCRGELTQDDVWLLCTNPVCPAKQVEGILHWIKQVGIDDLSDKRLQEMMGKNLVMKISDLYRLNENDLLALDKVKEKLAHKIIQNIQATKKMSLTTFLSAVGLEGISTTKAEKIVANGFNSIDKILAMTEDELKSVEGFAEKSSQDIVRSIQEKKSEVKDILAIGIEFSAPRVISGGALEGQKFCITGSLSVPRSEIEELIKEKGGIIVSSVSKNTNYLVTNDSDPQSSKFIKATALNVPVITENQLRALLG